METSPAISLRGVSKRFGSKVVFADVDLDVPAGSIAGISGPNGAGKSVLLLVICGLARPTSGAVTVLGRRLGRDGEFPPDTGALIDQPGLLADAGARQNLELLAAINGKADRARVDEVLALVGLDPADERPVRVYSNGMRKRLGIAQAILDRPRVLLLDEPTDAIDQAGWKDVYEYLIELKEAGTAILFSSNNLDEIAILCDRAYLLKDGSLSPVDDPA